MPASPDAGATAALEDRIARLIARDGPISLGQFIALANGHYYATRDPLGPAGDFTTAPEISQMFGELIGLCLADLWLRADGAEPAYAELGPGRGTLALDALRAMKAAALTPAVHLVETSPVLRTQQARRLPAAIHHDDIATLPADRPLLIVANEFFDALPVRQLVHDASGWRERVVGLAEGRLAPGLGEQRFDGVLPAFAEGAPLGAVIETSPAAVSLTRALAARLCAQGGAMIVIDYGYTAPGLGDTLQAVRAHRYADPFADPGEQDLTAHVDFAALAEAARAEGAAVHGPVGQGAFLEALGIDARADALARRALERASEIIAARERLTGRDTMGTLFKAMAVTAPGWPAPGGFDA